MNNPDHAGLGISELLGGKRQAIRSLAAKYEVHNVRVFGSVARGEARPDSDVDLLVDAPIELGLRLMTLWIELEELLGRDVDLAPEDSLRESLRAIVLSEAIPL